MRNNPRIIICGNEAIPAGERFYYSEQVHDSDTIKIFWGFRGWPRPEGVYANPETGEMYKLKYLKTDWPQNVEVA